MPTFSVIALDRLLETGASSKSVDMSAPNSRPVSNSMPVPESSSKLERRNSTSVMERSPRRPPIATRPPLTPALYATPEATPLPDSPTSFTTPSPYIVNHKRRGPRLLKSYSDQDVAGQLKPGDEEKLKGDVNNAEVKVENSPLDDSFTFPLPEPNQVQHSNGAHPSGSSNDNLDINNGKLRSSSSLSNGSARNDDLLKEAVMNSGIDSDRDDFFEPKDSMSVTSNTDGEGNSGQERSAYMSSAMGEFYDAWEELSSEGGHGQQQLSVSDIETELREMRLSLLMEIDRRKQAEESLNYMRNQWQRIREQLSVVGVTLPADPTITTVATEHEQLGSDPVEDLGQQLYLARFVSNSIGRAIAKAEMEAELEDQIASKNFEIARLCDKLQNYEAMNQEMVQRNQDVLELARREREKKAKRQRWVWGSIATALTLGSAALAYSYYPSGSHSEVPESRDAGK